MTKALESALDELLLACAASSDAEIKALAERVQAERNRSVGRPLKLSPADPMAMFIVFDGIYAQYYTDEAVLWQGVDQYGKPVADTEWPDGEPVAITESTIDPTDAIARELMAYARCSLETARKFARKQIKMIGDKLETDLATKGRRLNMPDATTKEWIAALKAAEKDLTNNS